MIRALLAVMALLGTSACFDSPPSESGAASFEPGQVWSYRARPGEEGSTVTIKKIERLDTFNTVVHVAVHGVSLHSPRAGNEIREIPHLAISQRALSSSVTKLVRTNADTNLGTGYEVWRQNWDKGKASYSQATLAESLQQMEQNLASDGASAYNHDPLQHDLSYH